MEVDLTLANLGVNSFTTFSGITSLVGKNKPFKLVFSGFLDG